MQTEIEIKKIEQAAPTKTVREVLDMNIGDVIQQGDVYLHMVGEDHPHGAEIGVRQVAVGDTQGSRHVAEGDSVRVFEGKALPEGFIAPDWLDGVPPEEIFLGPLVVSDHVWPLTHPEHAHFRLPRGRFQVTYQADSRARERVLD